MDMVDDPDLEDEVDDEVEKVMYEFTEGQFGSVSVPTASVKKPAAAAAAPAVSTPLCVNFLSHCVAATSSGCRR